MLSQWPIRRKLVLGAGLLSIMVAALSASGFSGLYAYRGLVKTLSGRSTELPLAADLSHQVSDLRVTLSSARSRLEFPITAAEEEFTPDNQFLREEFRMNLRAIRATIEKYRGQLDGNIHRSDARIRDDRQERATLAEIEAALERIDRLDDDQDWILDEVRTVQLAAEVEELHQLAAELPSYLRRRLAELASDVRLQYRTLIGVTLVTSIAAVLTCLTLLRLFYAWIFRPLRVLIRGSRQVAQGNFQHRIHLQTHDEMSELADAMNHMTIRFEEVRDDLDRQVRERTRQVVRSEQLASVGFLAAGVAHEINNPLASIAMCSESLTRRLSDFLDESDEEHQVVRHYLNMIETEAFRCKDITEKLLDFSRTGEKNHQRTELRSLVQTVIEMVGHMGRYRGKNVELLTDEPVFAEVSPQEMKQVVLNLITNGLDSLEKSGTVSVEVNRRQRDAELVFTDNGCGMNEEVLKHLFEPFFTRRLGGQGTGLGLSITYRIIADHNGHIEAASDGPGRGSRFVVTLPICDAEDHKESENRYQAA